MTTLFRPLRAMTRHNDPLLAAGILAVLESAPGIEIVTASDNAEANWKKTIDVNVHGTFNVTLAWLPSVKATRGSIINIASIAAYAGQAASLGYSPSKGAIKMLTQSLAQEFQTEQLAALGA